jgi:hypothetical protein
MADTEDRTPQGAGRPLTEAETGKFDHDVSIKTVAWTGIVTAGITALSFVLMWFLYKGMLSHKQAQDPVAMPMQVEAPERVPLPGPRLQATPEEELHRMNEQVDARVNHYSLVEGEEGYARIPVEQAMEMVLERGLGSEAAGAADGMAEGEAAVEEPGTTPPTAAEAAGAPRADSANQGTPSHSPESTRK